MNIENAPYSKEQMNERTFSPSEKSNFPANFDALKLLERNQYRSWRSCGRHDVDEKGVVEPNLEVQDKHFHVIVA